MKRINPLFTLLVLALILRLIFLFPQYSGDVKNHFVWGNSFIQSPTGFFSRHFPGFNDANYPPLAIFLFSLSNLLLIWFNQFLLFLNRSFSFFPSFLVPLFDHENMRYGFLKLPGILADLGIGYLIYKFTSNRHSRAGGNPSQLSIILSSLYLFNPAVIYLSSVWGQIEPITNFFLIFSLYLAIFPKTQKEAVYSLVLFTLAALTKQTALWFTPFYLLMWFKNIPYKSLLSGAICSLLIFFACYLPFSLLPLSAIKSYFVTLSGSSSGVSDAAWNFWSFIYPSGAEDSIKLGLFSVRNISIFLLVSILTFFFYKLSRKYSLNSFLKYLFIWSLAVFFLQTRVHERHLAPALVFGLLAFSESPTWWLGYLSLSLFHFLNLFLTLKIPFI